MTTPLDILRQTILDTELLKKSPNNHDRRKYVKTHFLNKELLKYLVEECEYSGNYISNNIFKPLGYVTGTGTIYTECSKYGILTRNSSEAANLKTVRKSYELTCLGKYGSINTLSKDTIIYHKRNDSVKQKYGVDNVFQLDVIKDKSRQTMLDRYGVTSAIHMDGYTANNGSRSKMHIKIEEILFNKNVKFESEVRNKFNGYNTYLNRDYSPIVDILVEDCKLVIEINGDKWHANPSMYKDTDMIYKWGGLISAKDIRDFDRARIEQINGFGYDVLVLWVSDIKKNINHIHKLLNEKIFKNKKHN